MQRVFRCFTMLLLGLLPACDMLPAAAPTPAPLLTAAPTPAPPPPTDAPPVTAIAQTTPEPRALSIWAVANEAQAEPLQRLLEEATRQAGVDIAVAVKTADSLQADVRANALADLPQPDLFWGNQEDLGLLQRDQLLGPALDEQPDDTFIPATIATATLDGQRWGTPVAASGALYLLYNKRLVGGPPATSDALIAASRAQTGGGQFGLVAAWAEPRWFAAWLAGTGGSLVGPDGAPTLDTPELVAALYLLKELRVAGPPPPSSYQDGAALFAQGRVAFAIDGDWALEAYRQNPDVLDLGIAPMPIVPGTGQRAAPPLNGIYLLRSASLSDAQLDEARALAATLTDPATQARIARELGLLPAVQAALNDPAVQENPALAAAAAQAMNTPALPPTLGLRCAWRVLEIGLPAVLLDEVTPEEAAGRMQRDAQACVQAQ